MEIRRSKRLSVNVRRTSKRIPCSHPYSSSRFPLENSHLTMKTRKPSSPARVSRESNKQKGVQRTKSGKYASVIWDRVKKKCVWLGTFRSAKEAREMYERKKTEIEDEQERANDDLQHHLEPVKITKDEVAREETCDDSRVVKESLKFVLRRIRINHEDGDRALKKDVVKEEKVKRFGYVNGVQICDEYGYMVGEFAYIDDLSITNELI